MTFLTIILFALVSAGIVLSWNRFFSAIPLRVAAILWIACVIYQGTTLFTSRVDLPGNLAFVAYPWKATDRPTVQANTGILFTQIAPWSRIARDTLLAGEAPLWNRASASGAPLLASQQTAIYHPFTLLGLLLPIGKAFTLSACLRLFVVVFFTFVLLRNWSLGIGAAIFGAIAYTFCSFHVVWLLFPLGLSTMMLPLCLVGVQELSRQPRPASFAVLLLGLTLAVLGGHPESALWVWIATMLIAIHEFVTAKQSWKWRLTLLAIAGSAFVISMLLTAFFWAPTLRALRETPRFQAMRSLEANPANHELSAEWLLPLIAPNVLGNPVNGTYSPPQGFHPAVLNDYGETASGYAGLATLALALAAPFISRKRPIGIALSLMLLSFLTFAEVPGWRDLIRAIPLAGISIHQRLRIFWDLGVCIAAAISVDAAIRGEHQRRIAIALMVVFTGYLAVYIARQQSLPGGPLAFSQFVLPLLTTGLLLAAIRWKRHIGTVAVFLIFADLVVATWRYNPTTIPEDLYPVTGAIATLQNARKPVRFAAMGWSFLPDTPGYYGIEDIKTTDPIQHADYMRFMKGYLNVDPTTTDQVIRDLSQPFFDYLNVRFVYVPPDHSIDAPGLVEIYRGDDGTILENSQALPRYFLVERFHIEPSFDQSVLRSKQITDFSSEALVDHIPEKILRQQPGLALPARTLAGGDVRVQTYGPNTTVLDVMSRGWNLLVSSDVHWPGWRAYWNGQRQPPVVVNGAFLGCFIPPGKGVLEFRYVPEEFTDGIRAAGTGVLALGALGIGWWARTRRRKGSSATREAFTEARG